MGYVRTVIFLWLVVSLVGCEDDSFIHELPPYPDHVVVNFVGENGIHWNGFVSTNEKVLLQVGDYSAGRITDAVVNLYEDDVFLEKLGGLYGHAPFGSKINFPRPGHKYSIEVITDRFGKATATYTQPTPIIPESFTYKAMGLHHPVSELHPEGSYDLELRLAFRDPPGPDFYEIQISYVNDPMYWSGGVYRFESNVPAYKEANAYRTSSSFFLDDQLFDGELAHLTFYEIWKFSSTPEDEIYGHAVEIRHLSREYYEFQTAWNRQQGIRNDPYAQPVKVPNNINNGFGVFGGFTKTRTVFKVK
jgi:hypothetical protein